MQNSASSLGLIWKMMLASKLVILFVVLQKIPSPEEIQYDIMTTVLGAYSIGVVAMAFYLPTFFINNAKKNKSITAEQTQGVLFSSFIVRMALFESVGIIGFVLAHLSKNQRLYFPFEIVSVVLLILYARPTEDRIQSFQKQFSDPMNIKK